MSEIMELTATQPQFDNSQLRQSKGLSTTGKLLVGLTGGFALGLTVICAPFISPALRKYCLPYIPATTQQIQNICQALNGASLKKAKIIDIGSGDGRIVLQMARLGFQQADGVELNPWLVLYSKLNALKQGQSKRTRFYRKDLWKFNLSEYDYVIIFGVEQMMSDLGQKFARECKKSCEIIVCRFPLPNYTPFRTIGHGVDTVWVYKKHNDSSKQNC